MTLVINHVNTACGNIVHKPYLLPDWYLYCGTKSRYHDWFIGPTKLWYHEWFYATWYQVSYLTGTSTDWLIKFRKFYGFCQFQEFCCSSEICVVVLEILLSSRTKKYQDVCSSLHPTLGGQWCLQCTSHHFGGQWFLQFTSPHSRGQWFPRILWNLFFMYNNSHTANFESDNQIDCTNKIHIIIKTQGV